MQYHLRMALTFLNATIFGTPEVFVGLAQTKFEGGVLKDEPTKTVVADQLAAFAKFIARAKASSC
jgi:chromate reductase